MRAAKVSQCDGAHLSALPDAWHGIEQSFDRHCGGRIALCAIGRGGFAGDSATGGQQQQTGQGGVHGGASM
jgi:hypothetical protein